jgi:hypothetical protein
MLNKSALTVLLLALLPPLPALAQGPIARTGIVAATGANPNGALNDIAYNDKQRVYLQVWGHPAVYGRFVNEHGTALFGGPFVIAAQSKSDAMPRVAYSAGGNDDVFLVRFTSELSGGQHLYVRTVRYTPNGPVMGPPQHVFGSGSGVARAGGLAFNPFKRQFLLTWETPSSGWEVFGQLWQLSGDGGNPSIAAATAVLNISEMNNAQGTPNVAYDWKHDNYLVVFRGEHPGSEFVKGSWARRVSFDANNTMSKSGVIELSSGFGEPAEQNVLYMPEADRYLTFWTDITSARDLTGRIVDHSGALVSGIFPILATGGNEGAADAKYSPYTRSIFVAAMREATKYIQGIRLTAHGAIANPATDFFQASSVIPSGNESFYPHVTVGHDGRFGLGYVNNYMHVYTELLQAAVIAGGHFISPPAAPPPPCTPGVSPTFIIAGGAGGPASVNVSGACAWGATSSASWMTITSGSSGTGAGMVGFAIARNHGLAIRTGTLTVGGRTVTVQQPGHTSSAVHDLSGDRRSDLIWHNKSTGHIAAWNLNGPIVTATYNLNNGVPVDTNWKLMASGDINGDGYSDLVWRHSDGRIAAWLMRAGVAAAAQILSWDASGVSQAVQQDNNWHIKGVGDLDGNGKADLIWQHVTSGSLAAWFLDGFTILGTASLSAGTASDLKWQIAGAGDVNGDGRADLIWQHSGTGRLAAWLMNGATVGATSFLSTYVPDLAWKVRGVGDVNGDGRADLLWQNTATGGLGVWYLQTFTITHQYGLSIWAVPDTNWQVIGPG